MSQTGETPLGVAALVATSVVCCVGLSLVVGAGLSVAAAAWIGGVGLGAVALAATLALIVASVRRQDAVSPTSPARREQYGR